MRAFLPLLVALLASCPCPKDDTAMVDADADGYLLSVDCDDTNPAVHPGAEDPCDGVDNDCDGTPDESASTWYTDADADGYGDPATATTACEAPTGAVADATDCDDTDSSVNPAAQEKCDGVDNNCDLSTDGADAVDPLTWYSDADGDSFGDPAMSVTACSAPSGYVADGTDCDPSTDRAYPGATETCDSVDNDCDGTTNEDSDGDCDDGDFCTVDSCGLAGTCNHVPRDCEDANPCTLDTCSSETGCTFMPDNGASCDDFCDTTVGDTCMGAACVPGPGEPCW